MILSPVIHFISRESILTLPTLKENIYRDYEKLAGPLREDFDEGQIERIYKVLCDMPTLNINMSVIGQLHEDTDAMQHVKIPTTKDDWISIHQNQVNIIASTVMIGHLIDWMISFRNIRYT